MNQNIFTDDPNKFLTPKFLQYSGAMSAKGGKWTEKNLDKYLKSPADYTPGKCLLSA